MKIYVGDIIRDAVLGEDQNIPSTKIAKAMKLSRAGLYSILNKPEMELKYILKIGKVLKRDFSKEIKGIKQEDIDLLEGMTVEEPVAPYGNLSLKDQVLELQTKYIMALEDNMKLKQKLREFEKNNSEK